MLEAGVEMWFKTEVHNHRVVMAIYVGVNTVETFEELPEKAWE